MQEEMDFRAEKGEDAEENDAEEPVRFHEEEGFESFEDGNELEEMDPDTDLEPVGEQSPNTREAFEEDEEEPLFEEE